MKNIFLILVLIGISLAACSKQNSEETTPACITGKIQNFKNSTCDKGANVKEYLFKGKAVYVFDPGTCGADMTSDVYDSGCKNLGSLGGIAGNTKINGEEFSNATLVKTIWEE